jgi:hypothetical protein
MLFMMIVKASHNSENANLPDSKLMSLMNDYNVELNKAGVRIMAKGLYPSSEGVRVYFTKENTKKIEFGPFKQTNELVAGFFLIEVNSKEEAIEWLKKAPDPQGYGEGQIELRQVR